MPGNVPDLLAFHSKGPPTVEHLLDSAFALRDAKGTRSDPDMQKQRLVKYIVGLVLLLIGGRALAAVPPPNPLPYGAYIKFIAPNGTVWKTTDLGMKVTWQDAPLANNAGTARTIQYTAGGRTITVVANIYNTVNGVTRLDLSSNDPYVVSVRIGSIGPTTGLVQIPVPYFGTINYSPSEKLFCGINVDYTRSNASLIGDGLGPAYNTLTDGVTRNPLRETFYYVLSPDISAVLPTPSNPPSPYRSLLGNSIVRDVTDGLFTDNAKFLDTLASYGITHLIEIAHGWENQGPDNAYPSTLPANAALGGNAGMQQWAQTAAKYGMRFGLHENYMDYYPNSSVFTWNDVSHDGQNQPLTAWKNIVQSYEMAPEAMLKYAKIFSADIQSLFNTSASFLDVTSAAPPWFHVDYRTTVPGPGTLSTVFNTQIAMYNYFRTLHNGPVFGEGSYHWYWSGLLDGVDAEFKLGWPHNAGETAPLFVDFDLLKMHPLQENYGMGWMSRWLTNPTNPDGTGITPPMATFDQYRMQELAYGHSGFVRTPVEHSLPFIWQEYYLVRPVSSLYSTAQASRIQYDVNGTLLNTNDAIAAGTNFDRVKVNYDNGLVLWANSRAANWSVGSNGKTATLPQYGWLAIGGDLYAYTGLINGIVVDYAETPTSLFANARTTYISGSNVGADSHCNTTNTFVNFGKVGTNGSIELDRAGSALWTLRTFPRTSTFTVKINPTALDSALTSLHVYALDANGNVLGQLPLTWSSGAATFTVNTYPTAITYRLANQ